MPDNQPLPGNIKDDPNFWPQFKSTKYIDKDGSPEQSLFFDRGQLNRTIYVAHPYLNQAILDFAGAPIVLQTSSHGTGYRALLRDLPHNYGLKRPWMWVQGVNSVTPLGSRARNPEGNTLADFQGRDVDDTPLYKVAEMSLQYVMPTFRFRTDEDITILDDGDPMQGLPDEGQAIASGLINSRYVTWQPKYAVKMLTIPRGFLKDATGRPLLENIAVNEHVGEMIYTWHQVPYEGLPRLTWLNANVVNDATFDGREPGTLLFAGDPELRQSPNPITGQMLYDVTYHFHSLLIPNPAGGPNKGWNYIRKPTAGSIIPMLVSALGGATPPQNSLLFRDFDFRKFFRPDPL